MTAIAIPPPSGGGLLNTPVRKLAVIFAITLSLVAGSLVAPAKTLESEAPAIASIVDAVTPDFVQGLVGIDSADALQMRVGWTHATIYLNSSNISWLLGLGYAGATSAFCWYFTATLIGAVVCAGVFYIVWSILSRFRYMNYWTCLVIRIRPWGSVSYWTENWRC